MRTPEIFIAYAPRGAGLRCAVAYLEDGDDIYGWFTGLREDRTIAARYFLLAGFHASAPVRYEEVSELHSRWSLDEARRHEAASMQDAFAREWLFHRDAPDAAGQLAAYRAAELAAGEVGVRYARLAKLSKLQPNWTYYSRRFQHSVLRHLAGRWPLEYRPFIGDEAHGRRRAAGPRP
ncbi:MAG TPA: hypothetical protein VEU32_03145 [Burkholderiales bacterium]|nr:hypothetical protein [Burkholderiales bacterium]